MKMQKLKNENSILKSEGVLQHRAGKKSRKWWGLGILGGLRTGRGVTPLMKHGLLSETLWWELPETEMSISQANTGQVVCSQ